MSREYDIRIDHYEKCLAQHGDSHLGVDWPSGPRFHRPHDALAALLKVHLSRHFTFRADYGLYTYTVDVDRKPR